MFKYPELPNPFPSYYEETIYKTRYARWRDEDNRRENWPETVARLVDYYSSKVELSNEERTEIYSSIHNLDLLPSMRALMTAGPALDKNNIAAYNCAYLPVDSPRSFDEAMMILLCGTGVGYSVESRYVNQLPRISEDFATTDTVITVADSKEGWAKAFRELVSLLIAGQLPRWDTSRVRPAGARLKTFGGRASGPEPLEDLFQFSCDLFKRAAGRRLTPLECHDLMCKIADIVVVGGVRRSAMISLFDVTDEKMVKSKTGDWWGLYGHRRLANNSVVYEHRPDMETFIDKWKSLVDSKSGEPGIFSRYACQAIAARSGRRNPDFEFGTNPCSEIILRPYQFCNLTEIVVRAEDTIESLKNKARVAAILGTIQSTFTDFKYLRKIWKDNCDEERLLGVSLTGVCDNLFLVGNEALLADVRETVIQANKEWAARLGINQSTAVTCVKPSGTVSQLVNSSSGLHPRHSPYYLRAIRADNKDPVTEFLREVGIPNEQDVMNAQNTVFYFPIRSPRGAVTRDVFGAIDQLHSWLDIQEHWCEHKPSVTINVKDHEWMEVGAFVYKNFDKMSGVSFLPFDGGSYRQAPYQEITEEEYQSWVAKMPTSIDWSKLSDYEKEDSTTGTQELACTGGVCDIVGIGTINDG